MSSILFLLGVYMLVGPDGGTRDGAVASAPSQASPPSSPSAAAVLVHNDVEDRLAIADLASGTFQTVGGAGASDPVWSPDGAWLAYRMNVTVYVARTSDRRPIRIAGGLDPAGQRLYAFAPDGRRLAVATKRGIQLWALGDQPPSLATTIPTKLALRDVTWADDGTHVAVCAWNGREGKAARDLLQVFDLTRFPVAPPLERSMPGCEVLGRRQDQWLLKRNRGGADEVLAIGGDGATASLLRAGTYQQVFAYLRAADGVLLAREGEDTGDPTHITLTPLSPSGGRPRPWLRRFTRLTDPAASADGKFVMFTHLSAAGDVKGGEIFLATVEGQEPHRVLPARASKKVSFSHPVPRP